MHTVSLRKVGGSTMLAIPPALIQSLNLGQQVNISASNGRLIIEPVKPKYNLEDLLTQCDKNAPLDTECQSWLDSPTVGQELL